MLAIEASCPNSWYIPQENHAQQVHTVILITRLFFNAKLFLHFWRNSCIIVWKARFLSHASLFLFAGRIAFSLFIYPVFLMAYPAKALINVLLTLVTCLTFLYGWLKLALKLIWAWSSKEPHKHMERESYFKKCYLISSLYHNV